MNLHFRFMIFYLIFLFIFFKNPLLMYSTIRFGTASKAAPQRRHLYRAGVGFELAIKQLPALCLDHWATTSLYINNLFILIMR